MRLIAQIGIVLMFSGLIASCDPAGVKEKDTNGVKLDKTPKKDDTPEIDQVKKVKDTISLDNGIRIKWFEHGDGEDISYGNLYAIDFRVMIENGDIIDGNHLIKKESVPFMIGFKMQTEGWDIALSKLRVGDFAEIFLPSELARGDKGIEDLIPDGSSNILRIRVLNKMKANRVIDGNKVWVFEENKSNTLGFDEDQEVIFHTITSSQSNPRYVNTYMDGRPFSMRLADYGVVPGLKKALINAKKSDRMMVFIPSSEAYKSKGYIDVVKPNEDLLYNMLIMDVIQD
ncbi:MAG: FKBP-type peptidyl-prolyl cis-trans isomerase [Flavobacteriaceae bacterium]|jgi:FKBP-type peptidyl-prolyl cis-trans isomerase